MSAAVHILVTRLPGGLLDASLLTFKTLRVGFPTAPVTIWINDVDPETRGAVLNLAQQAGAECREIPRIMHDSWIAGLLDNCQKPFWIADTDLVFWDSVEGFGQPFAIEGRFEPDFREPWSGTQHVRRLHTSLLYLDPEKIRQKVREWAARWHPKGFPFSPWMELVRQQYIPVSDRAPLFYDTCAALYQAIGGHAFTTEQNAAFEHLHCGTYGQRMRQAIPGLTEAHRRIFQDVNAAKGLQATQEEFYRQNALSL